MRYLKLCLASWETVNKRSQTDSRIASRAKFAGDIQYWICRQTETSQYLQTSPFWPCFVWTENYTFTFLSGRLADISLGPTRKRGSTHKVSREREEINLLLCVILSRKELEHYHFTFCGHLTIFDSSAKQTPHLYIFTSSLSV